MASAQAAPSEREPRSYTPRHLADKILQSKSALEGERKQVTALFADVKGSMELAEQVDPEEWHTILDRFFQILADGVHRFEGTVNQYTGDGIMALFGAPIAHEDHARRACYAALHLREELRRYGDELRLRGLNFSVRMGLNSGGVVVGKIGDNLRMDYTAQGQTVGLAARMEELAEPGKVLVTARTADLAAGYFELRDLGASRIKGLSEPLHLFELEGIGRLRTRLDVSRARGFSKFVGRADEMTTLELALNRAQEGDGQVVGVVGQAGVGKSRLCLEFVEQCRARDIRVLEAHCPAHGKTVPLLPILELLRNSFGITPQDRDQAAREKIAGRLLLSKMASDELLPLVFDFLGVSDPERPVPRMDPEGRRHQLYAFVRSLIRARSEREPAVLLFDDVQWIDSGSDAFLAQLVEATGGTRTMLLANFRPEYHAEWTGKSYYHQLPLSALGPEATGELLRELLGDDPTLASLCDLVGERTGGNPFFIEEVVWSLIEAGNLEGTRGCYRLVTPVGRLTIPDTVHSTLSARIDRLPEREKQVLEAAAVIGKEFSEPILEAVVKLPKSDLAAALDRLKSAEFLYEESLYPMAEYAFKHPLTQEVTLQSQLQDRRQRLHGAVARAVEDAHAGRLDEQAALLARHWAEAGEALQAARWHRRAAEWVGRSDPIEGLRHWQKVREFGREAPDAEDARSLRLDACRSILFMGGWRLGISREDAESVFSEGEELATRLGGATSRALLLAGYGHRLGMSGDFERWVQMAREADRTLSGVEGREFALAVKAYLAYSSWSTGRLAEALRAAEEAERISEGDATAGLGLVGYSVYGWSFMMRAITSAWLGRVGEARALSDRGIRTAREARQSEPLGWALGDAAMIAFLAGDRGGGEAQDVERACAESLEIAERLGSPFSRVLAHAGLAVAHLLCGRSTDAIAQLERSISIARERQTALETEAYSLSFLSVAYLARGDTAHATELARQSAAVAEARGSRHYEVLAHLALARALLATGDPNNAGDVESALNLAQALVEETEARALGPQIAEARAELAPLLGDETGRERHVREAHRLYTEMGATGHAERLARELGPR